MITREKMKPWIIQALKSLDGKAWPKEVAKYVWCNYEPQLRLSEDRLYTWQYDLRWAAQSLRKEGILKAVNRRTDLTRELEEGIKIASITIR